MRITRLAPEVANKIAAGEVVERPASVVKELAENAIDAGALNVGIEALAGGLELIRVVDDGFGMDPEDAVIAFERHASSKLMSAEDLFAVNTLGFRGEALPSIASVSAVNLITRTQSYDSAWRVEVNGGNMVRSGPYPGRKGTTVEVGSLFFNTPARLKYMKSKQAETNRIQTVAEKLALANPGVSIRLTLDGRQTLASPGDGDPKAAASAVFGGLADRMRQGRGSSPGIEALVMVGPARDFRMRRQDQHVMVNGRPVSSGVVNAAIDRGCETTQAAGRYPPCAIWLEIDPTRIDVNVHPAKAEVRFADEGGVFSAVRSAVAEALAESSSENIVLGDVMGTRYESAATHKAGALDPEEGEASEKAQERAPGQEEAARPKTAAGEAVLSKYAGYLAKGTLKRSGEADGDRATYNASEVREGSSSGYRPGHGIQRLPVEDMADEMGLKLIGQFASSYIIAEKAGKLIVVDQHVAHERILVDRFLDRLARRAVESQALLVPQTVELLPSEAAVMKDELSALAELGFEVEPFGLRSAIVRSVPIIGGSEPSPETLLSSAIYDLGEGRREGADFGGKLKHAASEMACKGAVKAGQALEREQMQALLDGLFASSDPYRCPHGRPIILAVDLAAIEKGVGRK